MNIVPEYSSPQLATPHYNKQHLPTQVLKDIADELLTRAKSGDKTSLQILKMIVNKVGSI